MIKTIKNDQGEVIGEVDENSTVPEIKENCPMFFRTKHGKREIYDTYRGQLIVRNTVQFTNQKPERHTAVYLYFISGEMEKNTFCVSSGSDVNSIHQAKRLIDKILDEGVYFYGI